MREAFRLIIHSEFSEFEPTAISTRELMKALGRILEKLAPFWPLEIDEAGPVLSLLLPVLGITDMPTLQFALEKGAENVEIREGGDI